MKKYSIISTNSFFMLLWLLLLCFHFPQSSCAQNDSKIYVITNPNQSGLSVSSNDVNRMLKGWNRSWEQGDRVFLALMKAKTKEGAIVANQYYKMNPDELDKYWLKMVFQGRSSPPKFFNNEEELVNFVKITNGAIGVITSEPPADVHTVLVVDIL